MGRGAVAAAAFAYSAAPGSARARAPLRLDRIPAGEHADRTAGAECGFRRRNGIDLRPAFAARLRHLRRCLCDAPA